MDPRTAPPSAAPMIDPEEGTTIYLMRYAVAKSMQNYMYGNMNSRRIFINTKKKKKKTKD